MFFQPCWYHLGVFVLAATASYSNLAVVNLLEQSHVVSNLSRLMSVHFSPPFWSLIFVVNKVMKLGVNKQLRFEENFLFEQDPPKRIEEGECVVRGKWWIPSTKKSLPCVLRFCSIEIWNSLPCPKWIFLQS